MAKHKCVECGTEFTSRLYNADYCGSECRRKFNNRRMLRGSVAIDLLMIARYDPEQFKRLELGGRLDTLIAKWHDEDVTEGRKRSWKRPHEVLYSTSTV